MTEWRQNRLWQPWLWANPKPAPLAGQEREGNAFHLDSQKQLYKFTLDQPETKTEIERQANPGNQENIDS